MTYQEDDMGDKKRRGPKKTLLGGLKAISPKPLEEETEEEPAVLADILEVDLDNYVPGLRPVRTGRTIRLGETETAAVQRQMRARHQELPIPEVGAKPPPKPDVRAATQVVSVPRMSRSLEEPGPMLSHGSDLEPLEPFVQSLGTDMKVWPWVVLVSVMLVGLFYLISSGP